MLEAQQNTHAAIGDLRSLVRGIHPPVLADRGLTGAVSALALDMSVPVTVTSRLEERLPAPMESALYFAVAECLANLGKHSSATRGWIDIDRSQVGVRVTVGRRRPRRRRPACRAPDWRGCVDDSAVFDGTMVVTSPAGGPTEVTMEVPCDSFSPRTTPSSAPG